GPARPGLRRKPDAPRQRRARCPLARRGEQGRVEPAPTRGLAPRVGPELAQGPQPVLGVRAGGNGSFAEVRSVNMFLLVSSVGLWLMLLALAFFLLATLRALGLLSWRLEQLEA